MVKNKNLHSNGYGPCPTYTSACNASSTSVILYPHPSEAAPLLPRKRKRETPMSRLCQVGCWCLAFIILLSAPFMVYHTFMHFKYCPPDPSTRDAIRRDWENEAAQHAVLEREWQHKAQEHAETEQDWKRTAERHEREVALRLHEEHMRQARAREEWTREMERHAREFEELKLRERAERELERQRWKREVEEREQREEEERQKLNMFWGHVEAHTCTTYGTMEYTAQLLNLPTSWKRRLEACKATPLEIHGIPHFPKSCEDGGPGVVIGRWEIDQQEPACTTYWDEYNDKGCTSHGSGRRHFTHKLMNLAKGSDWREFCATTPIRFNNMEFPSAEECFTSILGVYGRWEVDDSNC